MLCFGWLSYNDSTGGSVSKDSVLSLLSEEGTPAVAPSVVISVPARHELPNVKTLTEEIPAENRILFLNSLVLRNGRIVFADASVLRSVRFRKAEVIKELFTGADTGSTDGVGAAQPFKISEFYRISRPMCRMISWKI